MKVGFIGCGNMGGALAVAVSKVADADIYLSDNDANKAMALAEIIGSFTSDNTNIASECDFIFLGVKPNVIVDVVAPLRNSLIKNPRAVIVSMAAGVKIENLEAITPKGTKIIRIMPNTPVTVGLGMITWCAGEAVNIEDKSSFLKILSHAGVLDEISEDKIDAATAVAGCGPAFVYMFIDALAKGGELCGLDRGAAIKYACQTLRGAAQMVEQTGKTPEQLKNEVCSPGGSTIEGVKALENGGIDKLCVDAVSASYAKNKTLGK